ncbi:TetR/AcrR family transcriptional regulator [Paenibacillus koleovorans]|uniref:TetR/AcrR family transcriptional regulator n=1 Tax=Paenibacillus koleovorans TaxID=121608 RepID=UPI000FD92F3D|nr:TetR/AcrR family transcriptional regulator [Paenibacillus koleovorans]
MTGKMKDKSELILEAALQVFAELGYHRAPVSRIAKAAGVADGTIYLYFKSKEDILITLIRGKLGELVDKFRESVSQSDHPRDAIRTMCRIHYTELERNRALAMVTQIELRQSDLELRRAIGHAVKPYIRLIEQVLLKGMEMKVFRDDLDVKLIRHLLFGAMDEVVTTWLIAERPYSLSAQVDGTVDFFLLAIER